MASNPVTKPEVLGRFPPLPIIFRVPPGLERPWAEAWTHGLLIRAYLHGHDYLIHGHQLTTGPTCICAGTPDIWCDNNHHAHLAMQRDLGRLHPPAERCTCTYELRPVLWNPTHLIDLHGIGQRGAAWIFTIDPFCTHHGEPPYIETLDEDERRGH